MNQTEVCQIAVKQTNSRSGEGRMRAEDFLSIAGYRPLSQFPCVFRDYSGRKRMRRTLITLAAGLAIITAGAVQTSLRQHARSRMPFEGYGFESDRSRGSHLPLRPAIFERKHRHIGGRGAELPRA
jgi:hypothetical protein